jgi:hypothetical protein
MFPAASALRAAYLASTYEVRRGGRRLALRVGQPPPPLPWGPARTAAFVTAWNPRGRLRPAACNHRAERRLEAALVALRRPLLKGEGRGDDGAWPAERSVLVIGFRQREAAALGRRLRQNAVVVATRITVRLLQLG